ncbi:hypothetical protein [Burkholderia multivorans]|uniref:hypothetical protein n=1 Tax=Burkholderia multivorans TaxID=87883 RepID=UPI0021BF70AE|nr:hypothetical protein [Burkholderia multivorans]
MNEIKHTPGPWRASAVGMVRTDDDNEYAVACVYGEYGSPEIDGPVVEANAALIAAAPDMAMALEMVAAEDDAARHNGTALLTSGVRMTLDAALIKAGRKEAPVPVRHVRICGEGL